MTAAESARPSFVLETGRLILRRLAEDDAEFMLGLLNEPSFHQFIGDRGVRTVEEARAYIRNGAMASYASYGFGLWLVIRKEDRVPIGICGLLKRDTLPDADIGFAFRPAFWLKGYAVEAGLAVIAHGQAAFGLRRLVAITQADNEGSIRVLEKLGLRFERPIEWPGDVEVIHLYSRELA